VHLDESGLTPAVPLPRHTAPYSDRATAHSVGVLIPSLPPPLASHGQDSHAITADPSAHHVLAGLPSPNTATATQGGCQEFASSLPGGAPASIADMFGVTNPHLMPVGRESR